MTRRTLLVALIYAFFTLLVIFAVDMGGYLLAVAVQDSQLAPILRIIGVGCLLLLVADVLLLLLAVSVSVLAIEDRREAGRWQPPLLTGERGVERDPPAADELA